jgi:cell wall-associated NlpC family hydrolase
MSPLEAASRWIGVPYRLHGRDASGWDCLGCVSHARSELFQLPTPGLGEARYTRLDAARAAVVEAMISERLHLWRPVERRAGAVGLFLSYGRPAHVGLFLDPENVLHCDRGHDTVIQAFGLMKGRLAGVYDCDPN